jgi:hypothetical protein
MWSALEPFVVEERRVTVQPEFAQQVLDRALEPTNGRALPPEPAYHDAYVTAWRALDQAAYEALARERHAYGLTGDRYAQFTTLAHALRKDPREVLVMFLFDAVLRVVHGHQDGDPVSGAADERMIAAMNGLRLLYGWDTLAHAEAPA